MEPVEQIYALDIGTRTVVGLLMSPGQNGFKVTHYVMEEHRTRAMLDGQIHEIDQVAGVVKSITRVLEKRSGQKLIKVAVAAAGRALKTMTMKATRETSPLVSISQGLVHEMELEAVQAAQLALIEKVKRVASDYHCVGYSVVEYLLDGSKISNPVGQYGSQVGVEVIATFLPRVVVDSLFGVLDQAGLEMTSLTLEPIAAINVIIPPGMRKLNLALVDIGAGTSDIAVTAGGNIIAYAMVPVAGDEVTETICETFLLDFSVGEKLKRQLVSGDLIRFSDILGTKYELPCSQVIESVSGTVASLANEIASAILEINRKPPQAVVCVGGGSLTPGLTARIAQLLDIPESRVGIRGSEMIEGIQGLSKLSGPEWVTPVGIAVTALNRQSLGFSDIYVNNRPVRLFEINGGKVGDALLAAGINIRQLAGRPGLALTIEVNGQMRILKGTMGRPAEIRINGRPAALDTLLQKGDRIEIVPPVDGEPGKGLIRDVVPPLNTKRIRFGGRLYELTPVLLMDGKPVESETPVVDGCKITYAAVNTAGDLFKWLGIDGEPGSGTALTYTINDETRTLAVPRFQLSVNGQEAEPDTPLASGDEVEFSEITKPTLRLAEVIGREELAPSSIEVFVNGDKLNVETAGAALKLNGEPATPDAEVQDGDVVDFILGGVPPIMADVLPLIKLPAYPSSQSATLVISVNGSPAQFTTPIKNGDKLRVYWRENLAAGK